MKILLMGDLHGNFTPIYHAYHYLRERFDMTCDLCIQVGDLGLFPDVGDWPLYRKGLNTLSLPVIAVHGNHEAKSEVQEMTQGERVYNFDLLRPHGEYRIVTVGDETLRVFGVGGAYDAPKAVPSVGNFPFTEDCPHWAYQEWSTYLHSPPVDLLVTHEAPTSVGPLGDLRFGHSVHEYGSRGIRGLWEVMKPRLMVCGHYHRAHSYTEQGRTLVVLPEGKNGFGILDTSTWTFTPVTLPPR